MRLREYFTYEGEGDVPAEHKQVLSKLDEEIADKKRTMRDMRAALVAKHDAKTKRQYTSKTLADWNDGRRTPARDTKEARISTGNYLFFKEE